MQVLSLNLDCDGELQVENGFAAEPKVLLIRSEPAKSTRFIWLVTNCNSELSAPLELFLKNIFIIKLFYQIKN